MRNAPPVLVPVGRFVWCNRIVAVLAVFTALICLLAAWGLSIPVSRAMPVGLAWTLSVSAAWWIWRHEALPPGELSWDGQSWWFRPDDGGALPAMVVLQWDAGRGMLLQLTCPVLGRFSRYAWVQASGMPAQWHGLRCAVHASDTL